MLELFHLSKVSGKRPVLNNICMKIEDGERIVFTGDLRCSDMLLRALPGFVRLKRGSTEMEGDLFVNHGKPVTKAANIADYAYMNIRGSILGDRSVAYTHRMRKQWLTDFDEEGFNQTVEHFGVKDAEKKHGDKLTETEAAAFALALGMNSGSHYWLVDAALWSVLSQEQKDYVTEKMQAHTQAGGVVLLAVPEGELQFCETAGFQRVVFLFNGGIIADEPMIAKNGKSLASRLSEWKKVGI